MGRTWFHLSVDANREKIVSSVDTSAERVIAPRIPDDSYGENQNVLRVCVAATIWQCVLPIPREGRLYIYRLETDFVTEPIGGTGDLPMTDEKWITDGDVERAGGTIELQRLGFVDKSESLALNLKIQYKKGNLPRDPTTERQIWEIVEQEYKLRSELCIA